MPQYAILIYEQETPGGVADIPPEVMEANMRAGEKITEMGARVVYEPALQPSSATRTIHKDGPGRLTLQAAIAALHATAPTYRDTDWVQILVLYDELSHTWPSPVVALNRAVAVAMVHGPANALAEIEALEREPRLAAYHYLPSVKADLLRRLGRNVDAAAAYERAITLANNDAERAFLAGRLAETGPTG